MGQDEPVCQFCGILFSSPHYLNKHLTKKKPCNVGKYSCGKCDQRFEDNSNCHRHRKICPGRHVTREQKDKEIENYKTVLAATRSLGESSQTQPTQQYFENQTAHTIVNGNQINNIQNNNIFVFPAGKENVDYIKALSLDEIKAKISFDPDPNTIVNLFKHVRINDDHPENHSVLLPDIDGDVVHYKSADGWKTQPFNDQMRYLIDMDRRVLDSKFREADQDKYSEFYWQFLVHGILTKCAHIDHVGLKPIYDLLRPLLHELTVKLAASTDGSETENNDVTSTTANTEPDMSPEEVDLQLKIIELEIKKLNIKQRALARGRA